MRKSCKLFLVLFMVAVPAFATRAWDVEPGPGEEIGPVTTVPEPGSLILMAAAGIPCLPLVRRRWRNRRR